MDTTHDANAAAQELALLLQAQKGDFEAFEELVSRFQGRVYSVAYRILGHAQDAEDAEDVVQQTFLSVIEHIESFRAESSVAAWILRIATNFALKTIRKRRGVNLSDWENRDESYGSIPHPDFIAEWREPPEALVERAETRTILDEAISELSDLYRVVFVLRDIEGLSTEETASALGITESNVKVRLLRARLQLRERLTRELGDVTKKLDSKHRH
jgi:RNA polymerase sigma-70 factor (ECF subfamily)